MVFRSKIKTLSFILERITKSPVKPGFYLTNAQRFTDGYQQLEPQCVPCIYPKQKGVLLLAQFTLFF